MKKIYKYLIITVTVAMTYSCDKYLDINDPLNDPSADLVAPDLILAGALTNTYPTQANTMNRLGNVFMNNWSANINAFTGGFNEEYQLIITSTFYSTIWDGLYLNVANFQAIIDSDAPDYENHKAIAKIMKSFYMQYLVDLYGDVPYSEAFQGGDNLTPAYDDDMAIYRQLIVEVDEAIALIDGATNLTIPVGSEDVMYGGAMDEWVKFANTLKLRILMRESTKAETDGETASYLASQFATLDQNFITDNATINPGYINDTGRQNPFFGAYGFAAGDPPRAQTANNRFVRAAEYAVDFMTGGVVPGVSDPRVNVLYAPISGTVVGVDQGLDSGDPSVPANISGLGVGLLVDDSQDGYVMTAAESYFLQSEAAFRSYIGGDAKALFQEGIRESFRLFKNATGTPYFTEATIDNYLANTNNLPEVGWDGSANKIEAIMTQKWIATNGINAIESWIEYTRTGYPEIPLALTAQRPNKPNRLLYPASEYIGNAANVPSQETATAFNTYIFWDSTQN